MTDDERPSIDDSESSSEDGSSAPETELMITTRERRKTAGNRYSQVVSQEQADEDDEDDVALLFAEAEGEDEEYNSDEADDEADMSSSDDDDQGPNAAPDDMDGEKELEKQAKVERQKKRKADMALTTMSAIRKKPKIDPTSLHRAPDKPKPSKRKDRESWLPATTTAPGRISSRKQTVAHREVLLERLKENEEQRLKNKAQREEKEKRKKAEAPKKMTQADRLAEAERNERRNAKSLNRWEAMEKQRVEEQAARLAALKDRKLNGAVLTFHSSVHTYRGPKIDQASLALNGSEDQQVKKRGRKSKAFHEQQAMLLAGSTAGPQTIGSDTKQVQPIQNVVPQELSSTKPNIEAGSGSWLAGIHEYASLPSASGEATPVDAQSVVNPIEQVDEKVAEEPVSNPTPNPVEETNDQQMATSAPTQPETISISDTPNKVLETDAVKDPPADMKTPATEPIVNATLNTTQAEPENVMHDTSNDPETNLSTVNTEPVDMPVVQQTPIIEVVSTRNLVVLENFEDLAAEAKQAYSVFYGTKKPPKPPKYTGELCAMTGFPAKYRDPKTNVAYANVIAYKKLKELQKHSYRWSSMLGCYVGKASHVARGVPDGFLST